MTRTPTALQLAHEFFREGDHLLQVENTYIPSMDGSVRRVAKVGRSFYDCTIVSGGKPDRIGKAYRGNIPTRARDIVAVNDHTITHRIGRDDHTITLRRVMV